MLILKRILGGLIDFAFFFVLALFNGWWLPKAGIISMRSDFSFPMFLTFLCAIILPVVIYSRTLGEFIVGLRYQAPSTKSIMRGLLIKYFLLYCLLSYTTINFFIFCNDLLETYTYITISTSLIIQVSAAFLITNTFVLLLTRGKNSLLDRLLNLQIKTKRTFVRQFPTMVAAYVFTVLMILGIGINIKLNDFFNVERMTDAANSVSNEIRFPVEEFDNYTLPGNTYYKVIKTDFLATPSDPNSLVSDEFLNQRLLQANIKDDLLYDSKKREELCAKLIEYCYGMVDFQNINSAVSQTKIELAHLKYYTPFLARATYFIYYYDDNAPQYGLNAGFNADSLNKYYLETRVNIIDSLSRYISKLTGITAENVKVIFARGNAMDLIKNLPKEKQEKINSMDLSSLIDKRLTTIRPMSADSVKAVQRLVFMYPILMQEIFTSQMYDPQFTGAMYLKNNAFQLMGLLK